MTDEALERLILAIVNDEGTVAAERIPVAVLARTGERVPAARLDDALALLEAAHYLRSDRGWWRPGIVPARWHPKGLTPEAVAEFRAARRREGAR